MTKETHSLGGNLFAILCLNYLIETYLVTYSFGYKLILITIYLYFSNIGSLLPDIDMRSSYISKRYPLIYKHFGKKCRHRGFTHSLLALIILSYLCKTIICISESNILLICISVGIFIGYLSHLILDLLNSEGIELLFPWKANLKIFFIKTNSKGEKNLLNFLEVVRFILIVYYLYIII